MDAANLQSLLQKLARLEVCVGNADFDELVELMSSEGQTPKKITASDILLHGTIRHCKCKLLSESPRCSVCSIHRSDLIQVLSRQKMKFNKVVSPSSSIPNTAMTTSQLKQKCTLLQAERQSLKRRSNALQDKVAQLLNEESVVLDNSHDVKLRDIVHQCGDEMSEILGKGSPSALLWEQQKESAMKGKQMRWHPAIIRWCIALHSKSSSSYNILRQTGFIRLPHPSTLHPYTHFANPTTGFNAAMLKRIASDVNIEGCADYEKNVSLLFDEMKIKSGLFFSVRSGKVVGFTDVTSIANEVADFERRCRGDKEPTIATHVLVLMVRGIFSSFHAPLGYYPTTGVTGDQLYLCMYEAVLFLETAGFKVRALVSDGASPNRKFYRLHGNTDLVYHTINPFDPIRKIFFICDVPHLMKTTRNNWENSGWHNKTKTLCFNKQDISWTQLVQLYEWDVGLNRSSPGLRRLHRISYEHLHLTPALRMRVYMAAQVLSSTVAGAFESLGKVGTSSTVKFVTFFDQFFDCLNVSNPNKGARSRKPTMAPYKSPDDWRFDWLVKDFIGFLDDWRDQVQAQDLPLPTKKKMCLSRETIEGIKITVNSFVELGKLLLQLQGVKYLLSERFSQDPLEAYFSKQRGAGGANDNPSCEQFGHNMLALHVSQGCVKASRRGNCRLQDGEDDTALLDSTPLPRRK